MEVWENHARLDDVAGAVTRIGRAVRSKIPELADVHPFAVDLQIDQNSVEVVFVGGGQRGGSGRRRAVALRHLDVGGVDCKRGGRQGLELEQVGTRGVVRPRFVPRAQRRRRPPVVDDGLHRTARALAGGGRRESWQARRALKLAALLFLERARPA